MSDVSKGMLALRRSKNRGEKIVSGGEAFYFRKLTIDLEDELELIVKRHQDPDLKEPKAPVAPAEDCGEEAKNAFRLEVIAYTDAYMAYRRTAEKNFRRLTADLMKFILLDEADKPMFDAEDDVFGNLDNVYAEKFFKAYQIFRQGAQAQAGEAEKRFQG